jgi:CelD/BcsL family acetyltransferase involved in cellulose biosynthesis
VFNSPLAPSRDHGGGEDLDRRGNGYTVTEETFASLSSHWRGPAARAIQWECLFVVPVWLRAWWSTFGAGMRPYLCSVRQKDDLLGVAALLIQGDRARLMGDGEVCDYLDFVVAPGRGEQFFRVLIEHLKGGGISVLDLGPVRGDSTVMTDLVRVARELDCEISASPEEVTLELQLPETWDGFLLTLSGKERHEIRRKLRRLEEAGVVEFRAVEARQEVDREMETFLALFAMNRADKAAFMTDRMALFFRSLAEAMAEEEMLRLFFLEIDGMPAATAMCFDYHARVYLYNNAYDRRFRSLSVGLLSKVLSMRDTIERGRRTYDFLKGGEPYKYRLGGRPVRVYRCEVALR